jgi:hypothetical protein
MRLTDFRDADTVTRDGKETRNCPRLRSFARASYWNF